MLALWLARTHQLASKKYVIGAAENEWAPFVCLPIAITSYGKRSEVLVQELGLARDLKSSFPLSCKEFPLCIVKV